MKFSRGTLPSPALPAPTTPKRKDRSVVMMVVMMMVMVVVVVVMVVVIMVVVVVVMMMVSKFHVWSPSVLSGLARRGWNGVRSPQ